MKKCDDPQSSGYCVIVFLLGVADSGLIYAAVPSSDDKKIVVAVIYHPFDKGQLLLVGSGEQLHSRRDAVRLNDGLNHGTPFLFQIGIG